LAVTVSIAPQADFVSRIGGDRVQVAVMLPQGASEETYSPSPRQLAALADALLYVRVGHPAFLFESRFVDPFLASRPQIATVDMTAGVTLLPLTDDTGRPLAGGATDPHVWLAPSTVRATAHGIAAALTRLDPAGSALYAANLAIFLAEIDRVEELLTARLGPHRGARFLAAHASWGYLAHQFGLTQVAIDAGGKEPGAARLVGLAQAGVRVILTQPGFSAKSAQSLAESTGAKVIELDPMARDWVASMERVARELGDALGR
jgi:zinc transport system substrate-binding protein